MTQISMPALTARAFPIVSESFKVGDFIMHTTIANAIQICQAPFTEVIFLKVECKISNNFIRKQHF